MTLLYCTLGGSSNASSVQDKIACQVKELNRSGIPTDCWLFTASVSADTLLDSGIVLKALPTYVSDRKWFRGYYENQYYYGKMEQVLKNSSYDLIYYRHSGTGWKYIQMLKAIAHKTIFYIPSNSIAENFAEKKYSASVGVVSTLIRWFEYFVYFYLPESFIYTWLNSKFRAVVAFTPEFSGIIRKKSLKKVNVFYNRDGADCSKIRTREVKSNGNDETIKLVFMKGSSMLQPWAGLERLVRSIEARPDLKIKLYITGNVTEKNRYQYPFIEITGKLSKVDLESLIDDVDLGVSNLANYMIHFNETTNLKSRDYFARGLPFIQANTMPDIDGTIGENYYLNLPNNESLINMDKVVAFAKERKADKDTITTMRKFAEENLDWSVTVKELAQKIHAL